MDSVALILVEQTGVEFYTVATTGESGISISGLAILCGVTQQAISKLVKGVTTNKPVKGFEHLTGQELYLHPYFEKRGGKVKLLRWHIGKAILQYYYQQGKTTPEGAKLLAMPMIERKPRQEPKRRLGGKLVEHRYCKALAKKENGLIEVQTLTGRIDVLTSTELIEVKQVKGWKQALGQVLVYGSYYPSHQKRIHLFGETQESFLAMVESHCSKFDVYVTWEP